ncbi:MAG: adenosine kinase [Bacteroidales bacterium]|nr:adenosine kinase [Bacteroidales bacterium]
MKKILGMGNALVDIMIPLESDNILELLGLPKGSMQLMNGEQSNAVLSALKDYKKSQSSGGSAANTIHGLAKLGAKTGYIGVVGEDELGGFFVRDLIQAGVDPHMIHSQQGTGRAVALVTPDSERTFATFLGAAIELSAEHLVPDTGQLGSGIFNGYSYFHIEGYLVQNHALIRQAVALAKENGLIVSLDLASYNVVESNLDFLQSIVKEYVDILFANEEEARAFTGQEPENAINIISDMVDVAIVKTGSKGSLIKTNREYLEIGIIPVQPIDTTGAGDLYASGFLYGHALGLPLKRCGELGAMLAGNVIEHIGSKMPEIKWESIRREIGLR